MEESAISLPSASRAGRVQPAQNPIAKKTIAEILIIFMVMKQKALLAAFLLLASIACKRKSSAEQVKERLEKTMTDYLQNRRAPGAPPLKFEVLDVIYYEEPNQYDCEFKIKLYRPNGTDTTGMVKGKVSKDFTKISS
jgi:hypothetical protein